MGEEHSGSDLDPRVAGLVRCLDQAYDRKSWHGATFRGALGRVSPAAAAWRPGPGRPSIWEIVVHAAYWKHNVLRRVSTAEVGSFPHRGSNWFPRPETPDEKAWRADLAALGAIHRQLREAVCGLVDGDLARVPPRGATSVEDLVRGVAFHDVHHGGQVQLIKKLWRAAQ